MNPRTDPGKVDDGRDAERTEFVRGPDAREQEEAGTLDRTGAQYDTSRLDERDAVTAVHLHPYRLGTGHHHPAHPDTRAHGQIRGGERGHQR